MNARYRKALHTTLALMLVGASLYGVWFLVREFVLAISAASPEVSAAVVGAMATILAGTSAVLISQAHERRRAAEEAHRLRKVEIYQGFIDMISRMIGSSNTHLSLKKPSQQELVQYVFKFKSDLLLWGSPQVIRAQLLFESASDGKNTKALFEAVNSLYLAIREDIGLSNSGLTKLELVKLSLNNEARAELG